MLCSRLTDAAPAPSAALPNAEVLDQTRRQLTALDELTGIGLERPISELVARLCKDLGLEPDWSQLSQELWARREMASDEVGAPLRAAATSPIAEAMAGGGPRADPGSKPEEERVVEGERLRLHASAFCVSDSS